MQSNPKKVKFVLFVAIALAVALFVLSVSLIISINIKQQKIKQQQLELNKLNNQIEFYQNQPTQADDNNIATKEE